MGEFWDSICDVVGDSLEDILYLVVFLFVVYLLMEWLEHKAGAKTQRAIVQTGRGGPVIGALCGIVPQCGFSAVASTLYAGRVITAGTLFAVLLSTSDEMLPIFLSQQVSLSTIASILGAKAAIGLIMGLGLDTVLFGVRRVRQGTSIQGIAAEPLRIHELCERDKCRCHQGCDTCRNNPALVYGHRDDCPDDCTHEHHLHDHEHDASFAGIAKSALIHTVQITLFIFLITLILNALLAAVGEDVFASWLSTNQLTAVFGSALFGLIPNCAASVVIAELYIDGVLGTGAMMSGLLVSSGVGLLVLVRTNRHWKQNAAIITVLYISGVFWGIVFYAAGIAF